MTKEIDVKQFLDDFFVKMGVIGILFRDDRRKNTKALLALEITPNKRKEILQSLTTKDFFEGPLDDTLHGQASMWVFGKVVKGVEVYIKISIGNFGAPVVCISFHSAEHKMEYPFK